MVVDDGFIHARLLLDEPRGIYYAGQVLTGKINVEISRPIHYSALTINFIGEAVVFWKEYEYEEYNGVRRNVEVKYGGSETYFNVTQCLTGGMGLTETLSPGITDIPFQFLIPHIAPSSFKSDRGSVSYKVIAFVEYPDPNMERDQLEKSFEVVAPLDCNKGADIMRPVEIEFEEVYSCCFTSTPMNITIHIPHSGWCPGQSIPITIRVDNKTKTEIKQIVLQLVQKECYHSKEPKSDYIPPDKVLQEVKTKPVLGNYSKRESYSLVVPDMIAPNLQNCSLIDVGFFVKATVEMTGCNDNLQDEAEICLGLVPIASTVESEPYIHPMQNDLPRAPEPDSPEFAASAQVQNNTVYPSTYPAAIPSNTSNSRAPYPNVNSSYNVVSPIYQGHVANTETIGLMVPPMPFVEHHGQSTPIHTSPVPYPTNIAPSAPPAVP